MSKWYIVAPAGGENHYALRVLGIRGTVSPASEALKTLQMNAAIATGWTGAPDTIMGFWTPERWNQFPGGFQDDIVTGFKNLAENIINNPYPNAWMAVAKRGNLEWVIDATGKEIAGTKRWVTPHLNAGNYSSDRHSYNKYSGPAEQPPATTEEEYSVKYDPSQPFSQEYGFTQRARKTTQAVYYGGEAREIIPSDWQEMTPIEKEAWLSMDQTQRLEFRAEAEVEKRKEARLRTEEVREDSCYLAQRNSSLLAQVASSGSPVTAYAYKKLVGEPEDCFEKRLQKDIEANYKESTDGTPGEVPSVLFEAINEREPLSAAQTALIRERVSDECAKDLLAAAQASAVVTTAEALAEEVLKCATDKVAAETEKMMEGRPLSKRARTLRNQLRVTGGPEFVDALSKAKVSRDTLKKILSDKNRRAEVVSKQLKDADLEVSAELQALSDAAKAERVSRFSELAYLTAMMSELATRNSDYEYKRFTVIRVQDPAESLVSMLTSGDWKNDLANLKNHQISALVPLFRLYREDIEKEYVGNNPEMRKASFMSKTKETLASRRKYIAKFGARAGTQITRKSYTEIPLQGNYHDPASILEIGRSGVMGLTKFEWTFDSDYRDFAEKLIKGNISLWGDSLSVFKNPLYDGLLDLHNTHKAVVGWAVPPNAVESGLFTPGEVQAIQNTQITLDLHLKVPTFQFEQDGTFSLNIDFRAAQDRITEQIDLLQVTLPGEPQEGQEGFGNIGSHWTKMATQDSSKGIGAELSSAEQLAEGMNSDEGKLIQSSEDVLYAMLRSKKFMKRMQRGADRYLQDQASDGSYKYSSTFTYGMGEILEAEAPASDTAGGKYAAKWHGGGGGRGKRAHWKKTWEGVSGTDAEQFEWADKKNIDILVTVKYGTSDYSAQFRQQLKTKLYAFVDEHGGLHNALKAIPAFRQSEAHREHMYYSKIWRRVSKKKRVWHAILDANDVNSFVTMMDSAVPHKDPGKVPSILDAPTKFAEQQTDQAEAKKKLDKLRKSKIVDELPKDVGSDKRVVSFCYLGDLLEAMFEYSGRIFDYENFGVVVGTTLCYDYFTDKMGAPVATEIALVDLPISKELFVSWFHREYIKTTTKSIPLGSFLKGLLSKVVTPYTSGQVFPWLTDNSKLRTEVKEHSLSTPKKFEYGTVKYEDFRGAMWGGGGPNSKLTSNKYKIFCGNLLSYDTKPPDMVLRLAQDRGLLKTAKFTRMGNMENYEALIMTNDNQNNTHGVTRVRIPYNVDLEFVGNTLFFPGTVFELSPTTPGLTSQNMARRLGLGGQYVAQSVTCTIDKEAGFTTEFMAVNSQMATMPGFVENPAIKKSQDDEVKKIIDQRKGKTDAAKEAAKGAPPRNQREKKKKNE